MTQVNREKFDSIMGKIEERPEMATPDVTSLLLEYNYRACKAGKLEEKVIEAQKTYDAIHAFSVSVLAAGGEYFLIALKAIEDKINEMNLEVNELYEDANDLLESANDLLS